MAAPAAGSEPSLSGTVQLLLRNIDSRTTVVRARLEDTLDSVLERRLGKVVSRRGNLWVEYGGRYLPGEATIGELGLPRDATLRVIRRLRSTPYPDAWNLASKVAAKARIAAIGRQPDPAAPLDVLVRKFLNLAGAAGERYSASLLGPVADHMAIFRHNGAPAALAQLYLSEDESRRVEAGRAIRCFLPPDPLTKHRIIRVWTASVLLDFCSSISSGDPLYADLRRTLADVITAPEWNPACWLDASPKLVAWQLARFVVEKANAVKEQIAGAYLMLAADKRNLADFKTFSSVLRQHILDLDAEDRPRGPWWTALNKALKSLLRSVIEYMAMVASFLQRRNDAASSSAQAASWRASLPCVWTVLAELDAWSDMCERPEIRNALRATLVVHAIATRELLLSAGAEWCESVGWITPMHRNLLNFESRRHLAMTMLPKLATAAPGKAPMFIDRSRLLADSFRYIARATPEELRSELKVKFTNEQATGPGVRREWFRMVFQALFDPSQVLFLACPSDRRRFFVNPTSVVDPLHLQYYGFTGRMIALALMHKIPIGVLFDRTLFLQLADRPVTLDDIVDADPSLHNSYGKIQEMDPSLVDSNALGLTFVRDVELLGSRKVVELIPGGKGIVVNSKNLREYIHLLIQDKFVNCITDQVAYLTHGFSSILGKSELSKNFFDSLDVEDFNQMLAGSNATINVKEWKSHTDYNGYTRKSCQIEWFWKIVKTMAVEQQRRLLFFWTSVEYLPFDGFSGLGSRLSIVRSSNSCDHLPSSGTCFYQLHLPAYTSFNMMQRRLQMIVQEHVSSSFGKS